MNQVIIFPYRDENESNKEFTTGEHLSRQERIELNNVLNPFKGIFSDKPGRTHLAEHKIDLTDNTPINLKIYRIPESLKADLDIHIDKLLEMNIIEESDSPYSFPIVIVEKKNSNDKIRMAVNF